MSMKLYELTGQYHFLRDGLTFLDSEGNEQPETHEQYEARLSQLTDEINVKVENIGKLYQEMVAEATALKQEEQRLAKRRGPIEQRAEWLKDYVLRELTAAGIESAGLLVKVNIKTNPPSVKIINREEIPQEWRRVIPESWEPDKKGVLDHFKATGEIIPGVEIIMDSKRVEIK